MKRGIPTLSSILRGTKPALNLLLCVSMNTRDFSEDNDVVAWLILGYLCSYPDAKDTAEAVASWWLNGEGIDVDAEVVRESLDYLARLGWLSETARAAGVMVYGLNQNRRSILQQFLRGHILLQ